MKNSIRTWIIWAAFATMPINVNADSFGNSNQDCLKNQTNSELSMTLDSSNDTECIVLWIEPRTVIDAMLDYFDEEVKLYKLSWKARLQIVSILNPYFTAHPILVMKKGKYMEFVIDDKEEFALMVKNILNVVIESMPVFIRKIMIPIFLWWNASLQEKLDNLETTVMNMKEKQYKDVVFDYMWWIIKRVAKTVNWKMRVDNYYISVSSNFPNKHSDAIYRELVETWNWNKDIKNLKYPFK